MLDFPDEGQGPYLCSGRGEYGGRTGFLCLKLLGSLGLCCRLAIEASFFWGGLLGSWGRWCHNLDLVCLLLSYS